MKKFVILIKRVIKYIKFILLQLSLRITTPKATRLLGELFFWFIGLRYKRLPLDLSKVKKVLVVRLDEIGDVVLTTPFLRELRQNLPNAWITLIVKPTVYNLVESCPYVNEVLIYNWNTQGDFWKLRRHYRVLLLGLRYLWKRHFDLAIIPRRDIDYYYATFVAYLSGAVLRIGYSENINEHKQCFNNGFDCLLTHVLKDSILRHEVEHNLDIIRFLGGNIYDTLLELWIKDEDDAFAEKVFESYGVGANETIVSLHLGASHAKKQWPMTFFAELGLWLQNEHRARILAVGSSSEKLSGIGLKQTLGISVIDVIGKATLRQTAAFLKRCHLFIGNDSGPMHIAAALGVPIVELSCHPKTGSPFSSNSTFRFRPWTHKFEVIQPNRAISPCRDECIADKPHCILGISVEEVKRVINERFLNQIPAQKNI